MKFHNKVIKGVAYSGYIIASPLIFLLLPLAIVMYFFNKAEGITNISELLAMAFGTALITVG